MPVHFVSVVRPSIARTGCLVSEVLLLTSTQAFLTLPEWLSSGKRFLVSTRRPTLS